MLAIIWIDWYAYHVARLRALADHPALRGAVRGIELVGGTGVHRGLNFRSAARQKLPIDTLLPDASWEGAGQRRLAIALWRKLNDLQPAVVLVPGYYTLPGLAAALWARRNKRVSVLMTESTADDHARSAWKEKTKGWLLHALFDWAVAGGTAHVRYLRALSFPANRIAQRYDVVDNEFFAEGVARLQADNTRAEHGLPSRYMLYVGRLAVEKNIDGLLRAFAAYRAGGGDRALVLVGGGPETAALRQLAGALGISGAVRFAGLKAAQELLPFYAFADWFVLPSTREPWGLVVNEAAAAGLPLAVSTRCGCAEDLVVAGENGYTFDPSDGASLAAVCKTLGNLPAEARAAMGQRSQELVAAFSPARWADEVVRIVTATATSQPARAAARESAA